ncbi:MAG: M28 family peptidase [Anaerolineales bacterium]|jgi:aminopeptidase YwaD
MTADLLARARGYLDELCFRIPNRRVGSEGNRQAADFFAGRMRSFGFRVKTQDFDCIDWTQSGVSLAADGEVFLAFISPYSLACHVEDSLIPVERIEALEAVDAAGKVILLHGEIAKEQLMPKNFPFYNPEHHRRIVSLLEEKAPAAIIAATARNPELAGGMYPFPLIVDGDFDIPSVYMTDVEGERLLNISPGNVSLEIEAARIPSTGCNVLAGKTGLSPKRIVFSAHIDAKDGTPGALDNAAGVVVLLLLGELLADYAGKYSVELLALNGEDHYSAQGEKEYLEHNAGRLDEILFNVNMDAVGYKDGKTAYSFYKLPPDISTLAREVFSRHEDFIEGEQWVQGDHMVFVQNGVPALALTTSQFNHLTTYITHTPDDTPDLVDVAKLTDIAHALVDLLNSLK